MWYNFGASRLIPVRRRCVGGGGEELSGHFGEGSFSKP